MYQQLMHSGLHAPLCVPSGAMLPVPPLLDPRLIPQGSCQGHGPASGAARLRPHRAHQPSTDQPLRPGCHGCSCTLCGRPARSRRTAFPAARCSGRQHPQPAPWGPCAPLPPCPPTARPCHLRCGAESRRWQPPPAPTAEQAQVRCWPTSKTSRRGSSLQQAACEPAPVHRWRRVATAAQAACTALMPHCSGWLG